MLLEREALAIRTDIERHYPELVVDACGELFVGKGWELVVHDRKGTQRLIKGVGDLGPWERVGGKSVVVGDGLRQGMLF